MFREMGFWSKVSGKIAFGQMNLAHHQAKTFQRCLLKETLRNRKKYFRYYNNKYF
jgi:hypothetical protein